jgi:hypothetical protein
MLCVCPYVNVCLDVLGVLSTCVLPADTCICSNVYQQSPTAFGGVTASDFLGGLAPTSTRQGGRGPFTARLPASAKTGSAEPGHSREKKSPLALLVATLKSNNISMEDGYTEADTDQDSKVSESDLLQFCKDVHLDCSENAIRALYTSLDPHARGFIERDVWNRALLLESSKPGLSNARSGASTARSHSVSVYPHCYVS